MHLYFIKQYNSGAAVFNLNAHVSISYSYQKFKVKTDIMQYGETLSSTITHNVNGLFIYCQYNVLK